MSKEMTKQELKDNEMIEEEVELSEDDLEEISGGTADKSKVVDWLKKRK